MSRLLEALHSGRVLVMDGAMGTELQRLGLRDDECSALWNLTHPEQVAAVHAAYLEAGAEILVTNTFLASPQLLAHYGLDEEVDAIWDAAYENVHIFRNPASMVLADMGPVAVPEGPQRSECRRVVCFPHRADGLLLETWTAMEPRLCLIPASCNSDREGGRLPLLTSFSYWHGAPDGLEARAKACAAAARLCQANALGANCGKEIDMADLLQIVRVYREEIDLPLFIRPNAGTPKRTPAGCAYPRSPQQMADGLWPLLEAGVTMVGGCCGTTPAHIAAFRSVVDDWNASHSRRSNAASS
jgi:5-methyltetrahydrofolate--homocysteine methyltransferase